MRLKKRRAFTLAISVFALTAALLVLMPMFTPNALYSERQYIEHDISVPPEADEGYDALPDISQSDSEPDDRVSVETFAYGLYIDDTFICACTDRAAVENALDMLLTLKTESFGIKGVLSSAFASDIDIVEGHYPDDCIALSGDVAALLGIDNAQSATFAMTDVYGNALELDVSVITNSHFDGKEAVEYDTEIVYTDLKRDGVTSVITEGVDGEAYVVCDRIYIDGELISTEYIKNEILTEPVSEVIMAGVADTVMDTAAFDGFFAYPTDSDYIISSGYGGRELNGQSNNHSGIDLVKIGASCKNESAYASADGVVIYAGSRSSFGNLVVIKHTDRISTYYAHLNSVSVSVGDVVKQGQEIGKIGSTGNSTGPHLHFEIRLDDKAVNPQKYLDYKKAN